MRGLASTLREDRGNVVAEFPLVSALIVTLALSVIQLSLFLYVRNGLTDAAVQGAHVAALQGNDTADGARRAAELSAARFGGLVNPKVRANREANGLITVSVTANLPLVGFLGPSNALAVDGHAVDEESLP